MKKVRATGIGVHTPEQIIQMGQDDLQVLTDMLGDKPFFFGDQPSIVSFLFQFLSRLVPETLRNTDFFSSFHK